jgi:hypothetical protein
VVDLSGSDEPKQRKISQGDPRRYSDQPPGHSPSLTKGMPKKKSTSDDQYYGEKFD